ncbi:acyl-CoA thioesterase [Alphaproteobacteria bacterium]|nr:acyl-CoA thioesterase [Alphaproteobacteria bacterium]
MEEREFPPGTEMTLRTLAMPADSNPAGDIFGGWIMSQMDIAAGLRACEYVGGRTVTMVAHEIVFKKPVKIGDTICVYTRIDAVGRTSVTVDIEVWVKRGYREAREKVTEAVFVMVAVDGDGKPRPVPPLASKSDQVSDS